MPQVKIGIQLAGLRQPFKQALLTAARLGAQAVEIDGRNEVPTHDLSETGVRQIRKMLEDLNLRIAAVTFRTRRGYNVEEELEARLAATKEAMRTAYKLGAGCVVNYIGHIPAEPMGSEWTMLIESLTDLGRFGQHIGVLLAAQTGAESSADLARLIAALPEGSLAVNLNPGNLIVGGFSVPEAIQSLGRHVVHVQAKDGVRDLAQGRGVEVPLGRGVADFPLLIGTLGEQGYQGYWTIERQNAADPAAEFAAAVKYLKSL